MPSDKMYRPLQPYATTIPTEGQNCIIISVALSCLSLLLIQLATPVVQSYLRYYRYRNTSIHEGTVPSTYRSTAALYQGTLLSYSYTIYCSASWNQTAAQPWSPKRRQRAATKEHLLNAHVIIAVAARFRLISSMPSLMNRRGNNVHTVDVNNTTWYVHREGVPSTSTPRQQLPHRC